MVKKSKTAAAGSATSVAFAPFSLLGGKADSALDDVFGKSVS